MKRQLDLYIAILLFIIFFFLSFYIPYVEWKRNAKKTVDLSSEILLFKDTLTPELLKTYTFNMENFSKDITELKIEQFVEVLKNANIGGYSHPVYERHLIFVEKKEGSHFVIEIDVGRDGDRKFSNVRISVYDNERMLDGLNFQSSELEKWCESVGLL